jgi:hypothetical protein
MQALLINKAPNEDGLPAKLFVGLWDVMENDQLAVFKKALLASYLYRNLNTKVLYLLPKLGDKT